jgi:putative salt-induced outer membrane protein YdiY
MRIVEPLRKGLLIMTARPGDLLTPLFAREVLGFFLMKPTKHLRITLFLACVSLMTAHAIADVVETRNGARIVGKLTKIEDGKVFVATDFAGDLTIKQSEVTGITTDGPVVMRLSSGTTLQGTMVADGGTLRISGPDGQLATKVDKVAATWAPGGEDPLIVALRRHWSYEASVDIAGKKGNSEQLGTSAGLRAKLKTPQDTLQFYAAYDRQVANGVTSSDQFKAGIDYQDNFAGKMSWYARDEGGFDRVKDIDLYNIAAVGLGYDFIKEPKHLFTGRAGLSYRYESYGNPARANLSTAGLDLGINHEWEFATSKLVNRLSYVPSFEDFSNFLLTHESFYEIPMADPAWKLRLGVSNDYNSKPGPGLERLDTSYFTRLVLNWR